MICCRGLEVYDMCTRSLSENWLQGFLKAFAHHSWQAFGVKLTPRDQAKNRERGDRDSDRRDPGRDNAAERERYRERRVVQRPEQERCQHHFTTCSQTH